MLDLRRDLFARLVISAQKDKVSNKPFRLNHADKLNKQSPKVVLEERPKTPPTISVIAKSRTVEKIDEKVENIISDPVIKEIKAELEFAEALLKKIKSVDKNNVKIPAIEATVSRLKQMLDQKVYV